MQNLSDIIADMLAYKAAEFDAVCLTCEGAGAIQNPDGPKGDLDSCPTCEGGGVDEDRDLSVSGADLVDAFTQWRIQLREAMASQAFTPPPIGWDEIASDLVGALDSLDHQVEQMKGMFPDEDGAIQQAQDDGDEARERLRLFRKAVATGPAKLFVTVEGGNVQGVICDRAVPGVEVVVIDYDVDDEDEAVVEVHQEGERWEEARADTFDISIEPAPEMRERQQ